ncbi:hypothetical protein TNIN_441101 [Trichonephila inaurata madagascariensis]|uniref:Uncharacterized protein n=1 Tax=Trichonephila inaurata madagascariensis TaxID=2747483 RepID=A0A8X6JFE0_9ARAC|nr:hypothetical protein TNIN_441101 [Trichonephila inaurata madagascariensis]
MKFARVRQNLVAQSIIGGIVVKNRQVADGRLLSRHAHAAHDRADLRLPTLAKPSCGPHLRWWIQSACSSSVGPRIQASHAFKFRCPRTPDTPCVVHPTDKRTSFSEMLMQGFESFSVRQSVSKEIVPRTITGPPGHSHPKRRKCNGYRPFLD